PPPGHGQPLSPGPPPPPATASSRALLVQLELVKIWSHLLKHWRSYAIPLEGGSKDQCLLLFDSPSFLSSKPAHYQPFLTSLLNSSYFPAFLRERSSPAGLAPVERDAFDRYEASLSGTRLHVWEAALSFRRRDTNGIKWARSLQHDERR